MIIRSQVVLCHYRIYVRGHFTQTQLIFGISVPIIRLLSNAGHQAVIQRFWYNEFGVANPIALVCHACYHVTIVSKLCNVQGRSRLTTSDHYPVQFQITADVVPRDALLARKEMSYHFAYYD